MIREAVGGGGEMRSLGGGWLRRLSCEWIGDEIGVQVEIFTRTNVHAIEFVLKAIRSTLQ
jgi:hypothetical protein